MLLGVNFIHEPNLGVTFDRAAAMVLRPTIVRHVVRDPQNMLAWIREALGLRLHVIWCLPLEEIGVGGATTAARLIKAHGYDCTEAIEFGDMPWRVDMAPERFLWELDRTIDALDDTGTDRPRPRLLFGAGHDGAVAAHRWLEDVVKVCGRQAIALGAVPLGLFFEALTCHATLPGRPFTDFRFGAIASFVRKELGLPITFTRVGWPLGQRLNLWPRIQEYLKTKSGSFASTEFLTLAIRRRWLLHAYQSAQLLHAPHCILQAERNPRGGHGWPLLDEDARPDAVWHTLQFHQSRAYMGPPSPRSRQNPGRRLRP